MAGAEPWNNELPPRIPLYVLNDCDYNDLCKAYRQYVREQGHLRTLKEKAVQNPFIHDLVGTCFVHTGIKTVVQPESGFFDPQNPEEK